jgi:hypothetical protein
MRPETEVRVLRLLEIIPRQQKQLMDEVMKLNMSVVRLDQAKQLQEAQCRLTHKAVDEALATTRSRVERFEEQEITTGQHELRKLESKLEEMTKAERAETTKKKEIEDAERRKWFFYVFGVLVSLVIGMILQKLR